MAIRLEHQPIGISGLAAYAAGAGRRKERDRKYVTDIIQNQQARADKYNLQADQQRFFIDRDRERAGVDVAADVRRNAFRIGEINLADMKARERDEATTKAMEARDKTMLDRSEFTDSRDYARSVRSKLPPIPTDAPDDMKRDMQKALDAINELTTSKYDVSEPDTGKGFSEALKTYNSLYESLPKSAPLDEINKNIGHFDPAAGKFVEAPGAGTIPWDINANKPLPLPEPAEPVEMVTVPGRGQMPVEDAEKLYEQKTKELDRWEKGYSNAVTPEEQKAFEKKNPRPELPPSVTDLRYPEQPVQQPGGPTQAQAQANSGLGFQSGNLTPRPQGAQAGVSQGSNPVLEPAIAAARSGDTNAQRALDERKIPWRK